MTDVKINLEISAQRLIEHVSVNNAEIASLIEKQVKMACQKLDVVVNDPKFEKSLDAQIEEGVNKAVKDVLSTYKMREHIEKCVKALVEDKVNSLFNGTIRIE